MELNSLPPHMKGMHTLTHIVGVEELNKPISVLPHSQVKKNYNRIKENGV